ncbi:succinate-semialdehyde dehydrogenase family protein [Sphingomonas sp. S17]|uniref:NAD-dependent succinate-semialdehyde dehydrogenase n=3 Tax=Sphingomonas TaxID=13687 RepID=A0A411LL07_SPHPI|nr:MULTISPECIES: NAD-dependent succinate-semialdehyde dehydrogenase [Sphingomonas]EGI54756.1 succinate-semialdehyde dehydrogenase family protein [Sphingomonas sp. S17]MCM3681519.1 NAD-dependent succinate-semialdehyde dehydrogenase [Sphingomonas paucimobilis]MDG5970208.1 NAD-dependent succinate-semialdehyde dehydrogenase [Sphingomonas paucimobilis]NNG57249.1 NAD-dependent succinate-semialdehyde dehydrogenase [Sphingomonas paucimobilis]QBE93026.1 NAD-dependent succinate-semialdehyde dehydrogenas
MTALTLTDPDLFRQAALIGGEWVEADGGGTFAVTNPATGETIGHVPNLGAAETERAIAAAAAAFPAWSRLTAAERAVPLRRLFELMLAHIDDLAAIMTAEQGKPLADAKGEIRYAAGFIEWFAEEGKRIYGDVIPPNAPGRRILTFKQPIGVFAAITPWNFPAAMMTRKVGPGWAAGCTGIVRPASATPFSALALGVLAERAGLPAGVCNIVTGSAGPMSKAICDSPVIRKLSFTGSTAVGATLLAQCAPTIKKTSMELGGNAPFLVFDDADLEAAVDGAMIAKFRNAGQTCVCANRFLVQAGIHDRFVAALAKRVAALRVGDGRGAGVQIGPLIDADAVAKVEAHIADAVALGARVVEGGARHPLGHSFFTPTVLAGVTPEAQCFRDETFGPLAAVVRFDTEEQGIALANDTEFGLAAYCYTRDVARVFRVAEAVEAGIIGINEGLISTEVAPFGGVKQSGLGREGSKYGIEDYLEIKYVGIGGM